MIERLDIDCATVDELAAAYALGALDGAEERAVSAHLATCRNPHAEARGMLEGASLLPAALQPVAPSAGLRDRLMATVAATPQEHRPRPALVRAPDTATASRPWWRASPLPSALAAVALALAIGLGGWGLSLNAELAERDAALRAIASAETAYAAQGEAGSGWLIQSGDDAIFVAEGLAELAAGTLYELWLIDADGVAVAAGTLTDTDGVALVTLERPIDDAVTFALTVETERVEQSQNDPVMVAAIGA
jgi:anti-sigma-K factor RskA